MKKIVIKLGGSLLSNSDDMLFNYGYVAQLRKEVDKFIAEGYQVVIVVGGGYLCRKYQDIARQVGGYRDEDLHWIGIASINMNAEMLRGSWHDISEGRVFRYRDFELNEQVEFEKPVLICGAAEPGHSSDLDSVLLGEKTGSKIIYRLTDVDGIYDSDPDKNPKAKKYSDITWDKYFEVIGITDKFDPGGHYPIDPIASKRAQKNNMKFYVMSGHDTSQLSKALNNKNFEGTIVN